MVGVDCPVRVSCDVQDDNGKVGITETRQSCISATSQRTVVSSAVARVSAVAEATKHNLTCQQWNLTRGAEGDGEIRNVFLAFMRVYVCGISPVKKHNSDV